MRYFFLLLFTAICTFSFSQTTFETFPIPGIANYDFRQLAPADYDNDGDIDLAGTGIFTPDNATSAAVLLKNNGSKDFSQVPVPFLKGEDSEWADIDNDNDLDFLTTNCYQNCVTSLYVNEGNDVFREVVTGMTGAANISTSDFNNDGRIDVIVRKDAEFFFYSNLGNYTFMPLPRADIDFSIDLSWADFNNDGYADFASGNKLYQNNGNETFTVVDLGFVNNGGSTYLWADLDNDSDIDFVRSGSSYVYNPSNGSVTYSNTLNVYENQGGNVFADKGALPGLVSISTSPVSADFDLDGDIDVLINGAKTSDQYSPHASKIYWNNGNFAFTGEDVNEGLTYTYVFKAGDIDNDLDPDLLVSRLFLSTERGVENKATATASRPAAPVPSPVAQSGDNVTLSWAAASDAESPTLKYNLYVKRDGVFFITPQADITKGWSMIPGYANMQGVLQKILNTSSWPEGFYTWGVQALDNEMNASPFSAEGSFEIRRNIPSSTPEGLSVTGTTSNSVSLEWTDRSPDENSFDIERSSTSGNNGYQVVATVPANTVSFTDNTAQAAQVYYYRLRVSSDPVASNVVVTKTPAALATAPTNLVATETNTTRVSIHWDYSAADNDGFVVERSRSDLHHFSPIASVPPSSRSFSDASLTSGTVYFYRVFATSAVGRSQNSDELKTVTTEQVLVKKSITSYNYEFNGHNISWADYDNDGFDDVFIPYKSQLLKNNGDGTFTTVQRHGILIEPANPYPTCVWGDYDNDGNADIFVGNGSGVNTIFKNNGNGTFKGINSPVTADFGPVRSASWVDLDNDGDLELVACGDYYQAYFRYDGGDTFTKVDLPQSDRQNRLSYTAWGDMDDDGFIDAYLSMSSRDQLMMNKEGVLTPVSSPLLEGSDGGSQFAIWSDFNNDQKLDLTSLHQRDYIFASTPNGYEIKLSFDWYPSSPGANTCWVDFDNDGDLDFYSWAGFSTWVYENTGDGNLVRKLSTPLNDVIGHFNSVSWVDYNYDGFVDAMPLATDNNIYQNTPNGNGWIRVRLRGQQSNSKGVGAKILVKANGTWQRRDIHTGHSAQVQQGFDVIFGLGASTKVDSIKVKWPSGAFQYLLDQDINKLIIISEVDAQVKGSGKPSNLRGAFSSLSSIQLLWQDNSTDEESFIIQQTLDGLTFSDVATVPANQTTFIVNNLSTDINYIFRVVARKGTENSAPTNLFIGQIDLFKEVYAGYLSRFSSETSGASWMDFTMDGRPDLFLASTSSFEGDALYTNSGVDLFDRQAMITPESFKITRSGAWGDYNNDGFPDLFLPVGGGHITVTDYMHDQLWKNENGVMSRQSGDVVTNDGIGCYHASWGDLNSDGFLDLVVATDRNMLKYINLGGTSFSKVGDATTGDLYNVVLSDIDNDGDLDLVSRTRKFLNTGGGTFEAPSGYQYGNRANFMIEDLDEDGRLDLLVTGLAYFKYDIPTNSFVAQPNPFPGLVTTGHDDVNVGDFDNNGHLDVLTIRNGKPEIYLNEGEMHFTKFGSQTLQAMNVGTNASTAIADFNGDGTLDIFFSSGGSSLKKVLLKTSNTGNHWIRVKLVGVQSPRDGIGAKIKLIQKNAFQMREVRSSRGSLSANEQITHFGLGNSTSIEYLKIEWPSGNIQWIPNPAVDNLLVVQEANNNGPKIPAPSGLTASMSDNKKISLAWSDPWDMEHGFIVERSAGNETSFTTVATLPTNTITFDDPSEYNATVRYQVRTYFDNRASVASNIAEVVITSIESRNEGIEMHPNPANGNVVIRSPLPIEAIELLDSRGMLVLQDVPGKANATEHVISTESTAPGVYIVRLKLEAGIITRKLVIAH